jgi:hypothetical protein
MNNPNDTGKQGQSGTQPTDQGEDSEERRQAAEQSWKDRQGIPRGTPEQGGKSADRVGGTGPTTETPEIDDLDDVEREAGRTVEKDDGGKKV